MSLGRSTPEQCLNALAEYTDRRLDAIDTKIKVICDYLEIQFEKTTPLKVVKNKERQNK